MKLSGLHISKQISADSLKVFPYRMNWEITHGCNFNCVYCANNQVSGQLEEHKLTPAEISEAFDQTAKSWLIAITGGEPFLYPAFVNTCSFLIRKHYLQITTNLSTENIIDFAVNIDPNRVFNISASWHRDERRNKGLEQDFIDKCLLLKDKGFNLIVNLIAYPPFIETIESDIKKFNEQGINTMMYGFRGWYNNKLYPHAYSTNEMKLLEKYAIDETEMKIAREEMDFYGRYCEAGNRYFGMKPNGNVIRCFSLPKPMWNFFSDPFPDKLKNRPCLSHNCVDCYHGIASVQQKKAYRLALRNELKSYNKKGWKA